MCRLIHRMPDSVDKAEAFTSVDCTREAAEVGRPVHTLALRTCSRVCLHVHADLATIQKDGRRKDGSSSRLPIRALAPGPHSRYIGATPIVRWTPNVFTPFNILVIAQVAAKLRDSDLFARIQGAVAANSPAGLAIAQIQERFRSGFR